MRFTVIFLLLFLNCEKKASNVTHSETGKEVLEPVILDNIVKHSLPDSKKESPIKMAKDWTMVDTYFQVYTFSDKVMGLAIELSYTHTTENSFVDSVFIQTARTDSLDLISQKVHSVVPIDTIGRLKFYRNLTLETRLLEGIDKRFFLYCTNGMIEKEIKDVVFALDECRSNIVVFRFDKIDFEKYGHPLFCARENLDLTFQKLPEIDKKIEAFQTSQQYDYTDSIESVCFANRDSLYFAFDDDFNWNRKGYIQNYFPGRAVYVLRKDNRLYRKWALGLDLFGIPCD